MAPPSPLPRCLNAINTFKTYSVCVIHSKCAVYDKNLPDCVQAFLHLMGGKIKYFNKIFKNGNNK